MNVRIPSARSGRVPLVFHVHTSNRDQLQLCTRVPLHPLCCHRVHPLYSRGSRPFPLLERRTAVGSCRGKVTGVPAKDPSRPWVCLGVGARRSLGLASRRLPRAAVSAAASFTISFGNRSVEVKAHIPQTAHSLSVQVPF